MAAGAAPFFLNGCGLPAAWRGQAQWRVLATSFGTGLSFLACWQAWKTDPERPRLLHFVAIDAQPVSRAELLRGPLTFPELATLAAELGQQWHGLRPGFHRLALDGGQVLLTLCVGDTKGMLRELDFTADSLFLDGLDLASDPALADIHILKTLARLCRRGTGVAIPHTAPDQGRALAQCGFVLDVSADTPSTLRGSFNPRWEPKTGRTTGNRTPTPALAGSCVVIGAGLAGAAVAASLARRGWQVQVLDAAATPAQGASALPAGLVAPHVSPDDAVLSHLSRSGLRITLQQARALLKEGQDWQQSGVLERRLDGRLGLPRAVLPHDPIASTAAAALTAPEHPEADAALSRPASAEQLQAAGLPPDDVALWHSTAAWVKPAALVAALLHQPGIIWQGNSLVDRLRHRDGRWEVLDAAGNPLAEAPLVVVAAAFASQALLASAGASASLQAIRGQVTWARHAPDQTAALMPFPVNGHGSWIPQVPDALGPFWALGASFERDQTDTQPSAAQTLLRHQENQQRLATLLPQVASELAAHRAATPPSQAFVGIRCAAPDRLPLLGPVAGLPGADSRQAAPGLWLSTAMGSRGLTFALLCAELLAARLHGEPLPVERRLSQALDLQRLAGKNHPPSSPHSSAAD